MADSFQWGDRGKYLIAGSQTEDTVSLVANELVTVCQFPLSAKWEAFLPLLMTEPVFSKKCGEVISHGCKWAFRY
jgi:hypothetical protein